MKSQLSILHKTLPISVLPLTAAGASYILRKFGLLLSHLANSWIKDQDPQGRPQDSSQNPATSSIFSMITLLLQQFETLLINTYDSYLAFLLMMIILHLSVYHLKDLRTKKSALLRSTTSSFLKDFASLIVCYTLSFLSLKLLLALVFTTSHAHVHPSISQLQTSPIIPLNIAEKDNLPSDRMLIEQKPKFVNTMNEIDIPDMSPMNVIFSKDFHYAFEVDMNKSLVIYDISNFEDPTSISVLDEVISKQDLWPSGLISPKGGLLFIDAEYIQIVDVADVKNPSLISQIQFREEEDLKTPIRKRPSLAISSDEKYLLCSDLSFRIYDISDLEEPELVFHDDSWNATTVILSADDRTAFVGSEGELKIFDLADFSAPKLISSYPVEGEVLACALSEDQKTFYIVSYTNGEDAYEQVLYLVNVADPKNPTGQKKYLESTDQILATSLTISPDQAFLVLQSASKLIFINLDNFNYVTISRNKFSFQNFAFLPNGKNAVIFSAGFYQSLETYFNLPYRQADSIEPNFIAKLDFSPIPEQIIAHPSGERAFILALKSGKKVLLDINLDDYSEPKITETFDLSSKTASLFVLSTDGDSIYYKPRSKVLQVLNAEEEGKLSKEKSFTFKHDFEPMFIVSSDEETLFTLSKNENPKEHGYLSIYDISGSSPQLLSTLVLPGFSSRDAFKSETIYMRLSPDEKSLFLLNLAFFVINVSDLKAPVHTSYVLFPNGIPQTLVFSSDHKICFVLCASLFSFQKILYTLNTTDLTHLEQLNVRKLPFDTSYWLSTSDDKLFMATSKYFLTWKIDDGNDLELYRYQSADVSVFTLLQNTSNILLCNILGLQVLNPRPKFALYTTNNRYKLGQIYSIPLKVLELNRYDNYATLSENYKFFHASLSRFFYKSLEDAAFTFPVLPNWMSFDQENALLDLDLTTPVEISGYEIRLKASTQLSFKNFLEIEGANYTEKDAKALLVHLVAQGYVDTERYLTSSFDEDVSLILGEPFSKFEGDILYILKSHMIDMLLAVFVDPSLSLERSEFLQVDTGSKNSISVTIKLFPKQAKFVSQGFSGVKVLLENNKTSLTLEGALEDVNSALKNLLINLEKEAQPCEANITISDGLNPQLRESCEDITPYLKINGQPKMEENHAVQGQIDDSPVIIAGERFNIDFDESTFTDPNERPLDYSLEMVDKRAELPGWISLRGQSLSGTAPEAFLPYTKTFVIRASNEYKSQAVVFTLKIRLSWMTMASRFMVIIGYLFTAFKAWQHSDKVYNILCRKHYEYPAILKISPGQEISKNIIFPIALITGEIQSLSEAILEEIKKDLGQGKAAFSDKQTIDYLTTDGDLNKERLAEIIEEIVVAQESQDKISEYHKQDGFNKKLIYQLIIHELTMKRIKLNNEKMTLNIFEKIKSKWIELVDFNPDSDEFLIRNENLISLLQDYKINLAVSNQSDTTTEYSLDERVNADDDSESLSKKIPTKKSIEKELVLSSDSKINIGLLKDAILAHAFNCQNLWTSRSDINIQSRELSNTKSAFLKFARFNTKSLISQSTKRLGFGLKYEYVGNQIIFYGKLQEQVQNKTMVIQIVSKGGWMLREFFIQISADEMRKHHGSLLESVHAEL